MLKSQGKTKVPDWVCGYVPTWEGDQWIIRMPSELDAKILLRYIRQSDVDKLFPPLAMAPHPDGFGWYVGEVHP